MEIVDGQVHMNLFGMEAGLVAMDAVGVDAVLVDEFSGFDEHGNALPATRLAGGVMRPIVDTAERLVFRHPERFGYVVRHRPDDPDLPFLVAELRDHPGALALRVIPYQPSPPHAPNRRANFLAAERHLDSVAAGQFDRLFMLAQQHEVPVFVQINGVGVPGRTDVVETVARRFSELLLIVDHCGVDLSPASSASELLARFEPVAMLARYPNVALKWSHAPRISDMAFPYPDLMPALRRVLDAFGPERVMWASDWTREGSPYSWGDALYSVLDSDQLTEREKQWLFGGAIRAMLRWPAPTHDGFGQRPS